MLGDIAVLYLSSILYKIICLQFFICILLSVLLFYIFVSRESPSISPLWCFVAQKSDSACFENLFSLQLASAVIVTRPGQGVEQDGALDSASSKCSDKPVRKQGATLTNFILRYQKIFVPKISSLKFMH